MNNNAPRNHERNQSLWYSFRWYFLRLNGIRWQIQITHGPCHFRNQAALCRLIPCRFRHCVAWTYFDHLTPHTPPEHHKIMKTHRIFIIFLYFIGNYVACKNYTHTKKNLFIHLTRSHFSLIAKSCVALGTPSLWLWNTISIFPFKVISVFPDPL